MLSLLVRQLSLVLLSSFSVLPVPSVAASPVPYAPALHVCDAAPQSSSDVLFLLQAVLPVAPAPHESFSLVHEALSPVDAKYVPSPLAPFQTLL